MADIYVRSTTGSDANGGTSWADAKATFAGASAIDAAGDRIIVSQAHAETSASNMNHNWAGSLASPTKVICGNDGAAPPTAQATSATVSTTGVALIASDGLVVYFQGITYTAGNGASTTTLQLAPTSDKAMHFYENCQFIIGSSSSASALHVGNTNRRQQVHRWLNCNVKFGNVSQGIKVFGADFRWTGGAAISGTSTPTALLSAFQTLFGELVLIEDVDFSQMGTGLGLVTGGLEAVQKVQFRNCKLPSGWSGNLISSALAMQGSRVELFNCDGSGTNYRLWIEDYTGTIKHETTLVRSGGASDGTTAISWKMASNTKPVFPLMALESPEIVIWNEITGSSKTVTVEILRDSASNLQNNEIWLEVSYLSASGAPLGTFISNRLSDLYVAASDQTTSSATWTTSGMSNPNTQKLAVTFTPQMNGYIHAKVLLAKVSATVYVDPKLTVI